MQEDVSIVPNGLNFTSKFLEIKNKVFFFNLFQFPKAESGNFFVSSPTSHDIYLTLWRVINLPKDDLSRPYFCLRLR